MTDITKFCCDLVRLGCQLGQTGGASGELISSVGDNILKIYEECGVYIDTDILYNCLVEAQTNNIFDYTPQD